MKRGGRENYWPECGHQSHAGTCYDPSKPAENPAVPPKVAEIITCGLCGFDYIHPNWHETSGECLDAAHKKVHALEAELAEVKNAGHEAVRVGLEMTARVEEAEARIHDLEGRMRFRALLTFERRVDRLWVEPSKSIHYSAHPDGTPYIYQPSEPAPAGLYPAIIIPADLIGKVVKVRSGEEAVE